MNMYNIYQDRTYFISLALIVDFCCKILHNFHHIWLMFVLGNEIQLLNLIIKKQSETPHSRYTPKELDYNLSKFSHFLWECIVRKKCSNIKLTHCPGMNNSCFSGACTLKQYNHIKTIFLIGKWLLRHDAFQIEEKINFWGFTLRNTSVC